MAITRLSDAVGGLCVTQILGAIDGGGGTGFMHVYDGFLPVSPSTAITTQTLLGTLVLPQPCGFVTGKVLTFYPVNTANAIASGVARFGRITDFAGAAVIDSDISAVGGTGSIVVTTIDISINGPIRVESIYIVVG